VTPEQIALVAQSVEAMREQADTVVAQFYVRLFEVAPDARDLFTNDMAAQRTKFFAELDTITHAIPDLNAFVNEAERLGSEHADFGVEGRHYRAFGQVLIDVLRDVYADAFTQELEDAWRLAYRLVSDSMQRGAAGLRTN
jgi:nitric oxide dioxygenase